MNLSDIAANLKNQPNLRGIDATTIRQWAEKAGNQLASANVTRGYLLAIVEQVNRVFSECQAAQAQSQNLNIDELIFLEPHIAYQAGRRSGDEREALRGLKDVLSASLTLIASQDESDHRLENLTRLNQLFQAIAAYYAAN